MYVSATFSPPDVSYSSRENIGPKLMRVLGQFRNQPHTACSPNWGCQKLQAVLSSWCRRTRATVLEVWNIIRHQFRGQLMPSVVADMTTEAQPRFDGYNSKSTRTLMRVVILCFIAGAAISSRLFSVIRKWQFPAYT